jgi:hypothetical protein
MTMAQNPTIERMPVNQSFASVGDPAAVDRAAAGLKAHGFDARIVEDGAAARDLLLSLLPDGAQVGEGASATLDQIGVTEAVEKGNRYDAVRVKTRAMDRATQMNEMRKLSAAPDVQINSVQAVTEDGRLLVAAASGSQIGPMASGAGRVIVVAGAQKIVPDLTTAYRRLEEYSYPLEDVRAQQAYGMRSAINKMLVINGDFPGRTTVILVRETLGV